MTGKSAGGFGVAGLSQSSNGVLAQSDTDVGLVAKGGRLAAFFQGNVEVTGDIRLLNAADCAEQFPVVGTSSVEPGTVMVLGESDGALCESERPYDRRVAGVVSGAGAFRPGIVLDAHASDSLRIPVALLGKVYCKVDARYGHIDVGDLLTTSATPGHAMLASDTAKAVGAILGKALRPPGSGVRVDSDPGHAVLGEAQWPLYVFRLAGIHVTHTRDLRQDDDTSRLRFW